MTIEQAGNVVGIVIAALIAGWVRSDAQKHGFKPAAALGWSLGVFLLLIVFLPAYLWVRRSHSPQTAGAISTKTVAPIAGVPCPYCGYENVANPDYCGKCGRQMRSSTEIHR